MYSCDRITTSGQRKEFQLPMNAKIASVARAGRTSGRMMVTKIRRCPPPSMVAASSSSRGTPSMVAIQLG